MKPRRRKARPNPADVRGERPWKPPERSDQPAGEETVQVNDAYTGGKPLDELPPEKGQQHPTGG